MHVRGAAGIEIMDYFKMRKLFYSMLGFFTIVILLSCEDKEAETTLSVSPLELSFTSDGGKKSFEITSNTSWTVTSENENVRPLTTSGSLNQTVEVIVTPSTSVEQKEYRIVVKTTDGSKVQNVKIAQEGVFIAEKTTLQVTNYANVVIFGGTENDLDSLRILSNVPWQIKGPEWIEAWNGSRWVALSNSRATVQGDATTGQNAEGTKLVYLRTVSNNNSSNDKSDIITISPSYDDGTEVEIWVWQLGKYSAQPNVVISLADGIACDWECGTDVDNIATILSSRRYTDAELDNISNSTWHITPPTNLTSWSGLNENTLYYMYMMGVDKSGIGHTIYETAYQTGTSKNQALASIENARYTDGLWKWDTQPNDYCKGYYMWVSTMSQFFVAPDVILAWFMNNFTHDESQLNSYFNMLYEGGSFNIATDLHILVVTWAAGNNYNHPSYLISRFCSYDSEKASTRNGNKESFYSIEKNYDAFKNSIIKIN